MNCLEFQDRLQHDLDEGDLPSTEQSVLTHLEHCPACRGLYAAAERLSRGLALMPAPSLPPGFADRTVAMLLQGRRTAIRLQWVMRAAAAVLVGSLGVWLAVRLTRSEEELIPSAPSIAANPNPTRSLPKDREAVVALQAQLQEARDRTRLMATETARNARMFWSPVEQLTEPITAFNLQEPSVSMGDVTRTVSDGLEPVTDSAKRAWGMFRRMMPPGEERKKS